MAQKPIKFFSDALYRRAIIKEDNDSNKLFEVSGTIENGIVNINVPLTASDAYFAGDVEVEGSLKARELHVTSVTSSVLYETSISASINALLDVSASHAVADDYLRYDGQYWVPSTVDLAGGLEAVRKAGNRLKFQQQGFFDASGSATILLPSSSEGKPAFPVYSMEYISFDVLIKDGSSWGNDIIATSIFVTGSSNNQVCIMLDGPALDNTNEYRIIASNSNPDDYII
jgi:hypothetical protein